ncbi:YbhB/YbcL family Raf kinase inhibitor-like protein [Vitiosangium sp. GDMCC 1.1324]|uniref:YbhB/YbcL family Raf kinase inhibitor-like protein n=1 Tax=Vitiosangium sp. (strain GDMCC 1.1324) TaxID=2138576 RepID=UPI000D335F8B|nr:YbhB/YbcL family Raf kinase inhibitor-like protein [Vitiosangium sp. GDMCC 1.1324]PTL84542.1 YbhB/YbcL family Raf kinase inhibitor-like protein [Vitiosangium sp. GDMCC 1.1324]
MPLQLTSARFENGGPIPIAYTCEGDDLPPPLHWEGEPGNAKSFALVVEDPDAPDPKHPQRTWVHWVLYNVPLNVHDIPESMLADSLPEGARQGLNDWGRLGYGGPCPPIGCHRYFFRLFALDTVLPDLGRITRKQLDQAMAGHVLAQAELMGTYEKVHHQHDPHEKMHPHYHP